MKKNKKIKFVTFNEYAFFRKRAGELKQTFISFISIVNMAYK